MNHPILKQGAFGSPFGFRDNPLTEEPDSKHHNGVDLKAPVGTPVYAPFHGVVSRVDRDGVGRGKHNGHAVWLDVAEPIPFRPHDLDRYAVWHVPRGPHWLRYRLAVLHLHVATKGIGARVVPGDLLGTVGATGAVTGPHLHLQVWATIVTSDRRASRRVPWIPVDPESLGWLLIDNATAERPLATDEVGLTGRVHHGRS